MSKNGIIILVVAAVVFTVVGFFIGQAATALIDPPGSDGDPLVTQSYVEALVGERTAAIQTQLEELQAAIAGGNTGNTGNSGGETDPDENQPNNNGGSETNPSTNTPTQVKVTGNSVNLRAAVGTSAERVGTAVKDDVLTYLGTEKDSAGEDWYKVKMANGATAYMAAYLGQLQ